MKNYKGVIKYISMVMFVLYVSFLIYLTFFDHTYGRHLVRRSINIIPFKTVIQFLTRSKDLKGILVNIAGNIAAFVPMGFLLPLTFSKLKGFMKVLPVVLGVTLSIETFQYITASGISDIDDVILNVLGGVIGYFMLRIVVRLSALIYKKS